MHTLDDESPCLRTELDGVQCEKNNVLKCGLEMAHHAHRIDRASVHETKIYKSLTPALIYKILAGRKTVGFCRSPPPTTLESRSLGKRLSICICISGCVCVYVCVCVAFTGAHEHAQRIQVFERCSMCECVRFRSIVPSVHTCARARSLMGSTVPSITGCRDCARPDAETQQEWPKMRTTIDERKEKRK